MKWRHWAILIVLLLLNYIIFSTAFTQLAEQRQPGARSTRTPQPTFDNLEPTPVAWIVLPTSTPRPTTPLPLPTETPLSPTDTPIPPTATAEPVVHTVKAGETLSQIAQVYGVTVEAIMQANRLTNANRIIVGQNLTMPASNQSAPPATSQPASPTNTAKPPAPKPPTPTPTRKPPTPTAVANPFQFSGEVVWHPLFAPNCAGPGISKESIIKDPAGNPVNGARVEVNCYDNIWVSHPSGNPGEYDPGHYDFAFGQNKPQDWTCTARVVDINGQPVASSAVVSIHFDTNNCKPEGNGHQIAIVNWTKHW
jgi:LysM repeat protein